MLISGVDVGRKDGVPVDPSVVCTCVSMCTDD